MIGERDLNGTAILRVLDALEEIFLHEGFDQFGHGRRSELHGFRKLFQRNTVRLVFGQTANQSHRLVLTDADVDGGDVSDG